MNKRLFLKLGLPAVLIMALLAMRVAFQAPQLKAKADAFITQVKLSGQKSQPAFLGLGQPKPEKETELKKWVTQETLRMGSIDPDPETTERRIEDLARGLDASAAGILANLATDLAHSADERFMATYLLSKMTAEKSAVPLSKIALDPVEKSENPEQSKAELSLRSLAMDALSELKGSEVARKTLSELAEENSPLPSLRKRAAQALLALNSSSDGNSLKAQDERLLNRLLGNSE